MVEEAGRTNPFAIIPVHTLSPAYFIIPYPIKINLILKDVKN